MSLTNGSVNVILLAILSMSISTSGQMNCKSIVDKEPLRKMYFDQKTERLFVASTKTILELNPKNFSIPSETPLTDYDGECESGSECPGSFEDFNTQVILMDRDNLIVCGSSKAGSCLKVDKNKLTTDQSIKEIVSLDKNSKVHSAIYLHNIEEQHVFIGNSVGLDHKIAEDNQLKFLTAFSSNSFKKEFEIPYSNSFLKDVSRIDVVGSFRHSGYTYLIINRVEKGELESYVVRICDRSPTLKSLMELKLECRGGDGEKLNHTAVAVEMTYLSDRLSKVQSIVVSNVLFVLFSGINSSAICIYKLEAIELEFKALAEGCSGGKPGYHRGLFYLSEEHKVPCQQEPPSSSFSDFCQSAGPNFAMSSDLVSIRNTLKHSFYPMDAATSSFLVTSTNDYNVAFIATERRSIIKVKMPMTLGSDQLPLTIFSSSSYEELQLSSLNTGIVEMAFDAKEGFYIMGGSQICYMKRALCNYMTCDSCVADPYCAWCIDKIGCKLYNQKNQDFCSKHLWLTDTCPAMLKLTPASVSINEFRNKKIKMEVVNVPKKYGKAMCNISIVSDASQVPIYSRQVDTYSSSSSGENSTFICKEFSDPPANWNGNGFVNLTLALIIDGVGWLSDSFYIYDCGRFENCSNCLSGKVRFPCNWCIASYTCISDSKCQIGILAEGKEVANVIDECPSVDFFAGQSSTLQSNSNLSYYMIGKNVKEHYSTGLSCRFSLGSTVVRSSSASLIPFSSSMAENGYQILCSQTQLKYDEAKAFQVVRVDLLVDSNSMSPKALDNPNSVNLTLYKCRYMASSCGKCLLLDPFYECIWCEPDGFCSSKVDCSSTPLDRSSTCPNPTISNFEPRGGPLQGGTRLNISGTNLGMRAEDVQVFLDSRECKLLPGLYKASENVVCSTSPVIQSESTKIAIKVRNLYNCTSAREFQYKNPEPRNFTPKFGMKSGGTSVVIWGENLDFGSKFEIIIGDKASKLIRRNATHVHVVTANYSISKKVPVKIKVDGHELHPLKDQFEYRNNPQINDLNPRASLMSGGRQLSVMGRSLDIIKTAQLVVELYGYDFKTNCTVNGSALMFCPTPDLSMYGELYFKEYGHYSWTTSDSPWKFILDNVSFIFESVDKDYFTYYSHPNIKKFNGLVVVKDLYEEVVIRTEESEYLSEFQPDIKVIVGQVDCSHVRFDPTDSTINFKPMYCPQRQQIDKEFPVEVKINNFSEEVGYIKYPAPFRKGLVVGLILGLVLPAVIVGMVVLFCYARRRKRLEIKTRQEARNAEATNPSSQRTQSNRYEGLSATAEENIPLTEVVDPNSYQDDAQYLEALLNRLDSQTMRNAAKEIYIARERLEIGNELGRGHFGCVYAATLRDINLRNPVPVAVKTIDDPDLDQKMIEGFLKEGITMKDFDHPHVLSLLGLCLGYKREPMVILPFMANGDLRSYVKAKNRSFTARQLLQLAQQVAEGMSYLASLNFIHRDLAARNCMIDDKSQVKVADFGLSHELHDREYYSSKNRRAKLPIKWMALESLENYVFTIKSDVWSFGVLLWELMTRGITPYPDVDVFETRNYLASGRRLYKPKFCPENVYNVMLDCWQESPERRPTFTDLVNRLELLLNPPRPKGTKNDSSYINIQSHDAGQDYLKPIDPSHEEEEQSRSTVPTNQEEEEDEDSDQSSRHSGGSVEVRAVKETSRIKEATV